MLSVLLLAAPNFALLRQEPQPEATPVVVPQAESSSKSRRGKLPENDPQAVEFLAKLIAAQRTTEILPDVEFFAMEVNLREFGEERANQLDLRLDFDSRDGSFRLAVDDIDYGKRISKGWHPELGYWLVDPEDQLVRLDAKEFQNDRKMIDETLSFCEDFMLLFDLSRLKRKAGGLKLEKYEGGQVLKGVMRRSGRALWAFELSVAKGQVLPHQLVLTPPAPQEPSASEAAAEPQQPDAPADKSVGPEEAENSKEQDAKQAPRKLVYLFEDWIEQGGRRLPQWIDEFEDVSQEVLLRAITVNGFVWREESIVNTRPPQADLKKLGREEGKEGE